jgi:hypothetical protein
MHKERSGQGYQFLQGTRSALDGISDDAIVISKKNIPKFIF